METGHKTLTLTFEQCKSIDKMLQVYFDLGYVEEEHFSQEQKKALHEAHEILKIARPDWTF